MATKKILRFDDNMTFFAFRYCLGRRTGAVDMCVNYIVRNWNALKQHTKIQIKREIVEAELENMSLGSKWDKEKWLSILKLPAKEK